MKVRNFKYNATQNNNFGVAICKENIGDLFEFSIQFTFQAYHDCMVGKSFDKVNLPKNLN